MPSAWHVRSKWAALALGRTASSPTACPPCFVEVLAGVVARLERSRRSTLTWRIVSVGDVYADLLRVLL